MSSLDTPNVPEAHLNEMTDNDVHRICCWLLANAHDAIAQSGCSDAAAITVGDKKTKQNPLNDYTTDNNGDERDYGVISIDAYIETDSDTLFCTHGVLVESETPQNFGQLEIHETIIVRSGTLRCWIDGEQQPDISKDSLCDIMFVNKDEELMVQAIDGPVDYTCFYDEDGRSHVQMKKGSDASNTALR